MTPHVQKDVPFAVSFTRCALNHFVNDNELSEVSVSCSRYNSALRLFHFRTFFLILQLLFFKLFSVRRACEWNYHHPRWDRASLFFCLGQASSHSMHGHIIGLLVCVVRLLVVFRQRSVHGRSSLHVQVFFRTSTTETPITKSESCYVSKHFYRLSWTFLYFLTFFSQ